MKAFVRASAHLAVAIALLILTGCGEAPPSVESSSTEATVSGVIRVDGVPVTEGDVIFDPSNIQRSSAAPRRAPIDKDGKYTVKTLLGENSIKLSGEAAHKNQVLQGMQKAFNVLAGENTFDLDFKTK